MIALRPESHRCNGKRPEIVVGLTDEGGVCLTVEAGPLETLDDRDLDRYLTADEARALAAMLNHYANESERPR